MSVTATHLQLVHFKEVRRKQRGFAAARTSANFEHGTASVSIVDRHQTLQNLELFAIQLLPRLSAVVSTA